MVAIPVVWLFSQQLLPSPCSQQGQLIICVAASDLQQLVYCLKISFRNFVTQREALIFPFSWLCSKDIKYLQRCRIADWDTCSPLHERNVCRNILESQGAFGNFKKNLLRSQSR